MKRRREPRRKLSTSLWPSHKPRHQKRGRPRFFVETLEWRLALSITNPPGTDQFNTVDPITSFMAGAGDAPFSLASLGQEFLPATSSLTFVTLAVKNNDPIDPIRLHVNIREADLFTHQIDEPILGTAYATVQPGFDSVSASTLQQMVVFSFNSPVTLTPFTPYVMEVVSSDASSTDFYASGDNYPQGQVDSSAPNSDQYDLDFQEGTSPGPGPTFIVTNTNFNGAGSLAQAILDANNANQLPATIDFNIPTSDPNYSATTHAWTIDAPLPPVYVPVIIDGSSQPGFAGSPVIEISGRLGGSYDGLDILGGNSTIKSLIVDQNHGSGIVLEAGGSVVEDCYIGTDPTGRVASGNAIDANSIGSIGAGILIMSSGNTIGGTGPAARNIISGNVGAGVAVIGGSLLDPQDPVSGNVIEGNYIGVDVTGNSALANNTGGFTYGGVWIESGDNTVGGTIAGAGNVISGNTGNGVLINAPFGPGSLVEGNFIGTNAGGTAALPNTKNGVYLVEGSGNTIGGATPTPGTGAGNVISGNLQDGVLIEAPSSGNTVEGNLIGTNATATVALGNGTNGVEINDDGRTFGNATNNTIGGTTPDARNIIAGNVGNGVLITGGSSTGNLIEGNWIGDKVVPFTTTEFTVPTAASLPTSILAGPDGNLWFGEENANKIARITTTGIITEFAIPTSGGYANRLTTGPDGNIWFVYSTGKIFRLTTSGDFTEFQIPTAGSAPTDITSGPDGNLWFTEYYGNKIGRITTAGVITEYAVPTSGGHPDTIVTGPDGNLWFTESEGSKIGRITTGGAITEFSTPTAGSQPSGITVGPDNNIWFAESIASKIGKITTAGAITEYALTAGSGPNGITLGPDGNLWFTEPGSSHIGRITLGGTITEFPSGQSYWVTTGPDGNLWFPEYNLNKIARFSVTGVIANGADGVAIAGGANRNTVGGSTPSPGTSAGNVISGNIGNGVSIDASGSDNNTIAGNFIGIDATGTVAVPNYRRGVTIGAGPSGNLIGGTASVDRNIISGNGYEGVAFDGASGNLLEGNYIGTDATGTLAVGNGYAGESVAGTPLLGVILLAGATSNVVGGTIAGAGNVISGNAAGGVGILDAGTSQNLVEGNYIGTDAMGTTAVPNALSGVAIGNGATNNIIGGNVAGAPNVVSGNSSDGIYVADPGTSGNQIAGNYIGVDPSGLVAVSNGLDGVQIANGASGNFVGTNSDGVNDGHEGNVIAANKQQDVEIFGSNANTVAGNLIGTDKTGNVVLNGPTFIGVWIGGGSQNNLIGGVTNAARNVINGHTFSGVQITGQVFNAGQPPTRGNRVQGNYIGLEPDGLHALGNGSDGVALVAGATANFIGTDADGVHDAAERNIISGNAGNGVSIDATSTANTIQGNLIGTNATQTAALANAQNGVYVAGANNTIGGSAAGDGNTITGNTQNGIDLSGAAATGNAIEGNNLGATGNGQPVITEFAIPTPSTHADAITTGPDGNLWFTEETANKIARRTSDGTITEFTVPNANSQPFGITTGPDGNLWFTESGNAANSIGRLTPAGVFTEFSIPTPNSVAGGITTGPDGNLWFTEGYGSKIGRITPQGVITEYPILTVGGHPGDSIVSGPDGNLWFTEFVPNRIGRITTSGVVTEFTVPTANGQVGNITVGPDKNLWFAEEGGSIAKMTTSGVVTEFPVPTPNSTPYDITVGPDGNLWFTEWNTNAVAKIGRATTAGVVTEFTVPTPGSGPHFITTGPDGNLWFTEVPGNNIARLTLSLNAGNGGDGVRIEGGASGNTIGGTASGTGNTIASNGGGVVVMGASSVRNAIRQNLIHDNGGLGIDLGGSGAPVTNDSFGHSGPNNYQNFPVLASVAFGATTTVAGSLVSSPNTTFDLDFFANDSADPSGYGEGQIFLGSATVATDGTGTGTFNITLPGATTPGQRITATATDFAGNTSEFAQDLLPKITGTDLPSEGATTTAVVDGFSLSFSEDMLAATVNDPANYDLRSAGADGQFNTTDDVVYHVAPYPSNYTSGPDATFRITDGPLQAGSYRLTVSNLTDLSSVAMLAPFVRDFTVAGTGLVIYPANDGFELPNLQSNTSGNYKYSVTLADQGGSGWTFTGPTGVADNGSDPGGNSFNVVNATNGNHDGTRSNFGQAAFIQNLGNSGPSVISQAITFPSDGNASVTFSIELRERLAIGNNPIDVKLDDADLGTYLALSGSSFNTVTTPSVFLTAGVHTLSFTGTNIAPGGDNTQFIDNVEVLLKGTDQPTVSNTNDSGPGSLRQAIIEADAASASPTSIAFDIPQTDPNYHSATGAWTISPLSQLPPLAFGVSIDGGSQPGYVDRPIVELNGSQAGVFTPGLVLSGGNSTIKDLVIDQFNGYGIYLVAGANVIEGCYIGTDATGHTASGNGTGVLVTSSGNTLGGSGAGTRNVISANDGDGVMILGDTETDNLIEGNYIGTDATGTLPLGNTFGGVRIFGNVHNTIGGNSVIGNVISANSLELGPPDAFGQQFYTASYAGVEVNAADSNIIAGNLIGTDATGTLSLPNAYGVLIDGDNNRIGTDPSSPLISDRNIITGNLYTQISISGNHNKVAGNFVGTDVTGTSAIPFFNPPPPSFQPPQLLEAQGIVVSGSDNTVGGLSVTPGAAGGNVISGNGSVGLTIAFNAVGTLVEGNLIGTDSTGLQAVANDDDGVNIFGSNNSIGGDDPRARNIISHNTGDGVMISGTSSVANAVRGNSIYGNGGLGIDLGGSGTPVMNDSQGHVGPNDYANFPTIGSVVGGDTTIVAGSLTSTPSTTFDLDFFSNDAADPSGYGQGQTYLGSVTIASDSTGLAGFNVTLPGSSGPGQYITATATDSAGNTSEFSQDFAEAVNDTPPVVTIAAKTAAQAGMPLAVDSQVVYANPSGTFQYQWSVTSANDPSFKLSADTIADEPTLRFTPPAAGDYRIALTVSDNLGGIGSAGITMTAAAATPPVLVAGAPGVATTGSAISLNASTFEPAGVTVTSYTWSVTLDGAPFALPPGTPTNADKFSFTPTQNGLYQVVLTTADSSGASASGTVPIFAFNAAPEAVIAPPNLTPREGVPLSVYAQTTSPNLLGVLTYQWTVLRGGAVVASTSNAGSVYTFTPDEEGPYQIELTVSDSHGDAANATPVSVNVVDLPPTAAIAAAPTRSLAGLPIQLTGSGVTPGTVDQVSLAWSVFNETLGTQAAVGSGANFSFTPRDAGLDLVTLTATNDDGAQSSANALIEIDAPAASLALAPQSTLIEGSPGTFVANVPEAKPGVSYAFSWTVTGESVPFASYGAGTPLGAGGSQFTFTPPLPGVYFVGVSIQGSDHSSAGSSQLVTAANVAPSVTIGGLPTAAAVEGTPVMLSANASDPGGAADPLTYQWLATGPGFSQSGTSSKFNFTPLVAGSYQVTLWTTDTSGATTETGAIFAVTHQPPAPVVEAATGTTTNAQGQLVVDLTAAVTEPGGIAGFNYQWTATYLDTSVSPPAMVVAATQDSTNPNFSFTETTSYAYSVSLVVTDTQGASGAVAAPVIVTDRTLTLTDADLPAGATELLVIALSPDVTIDGSRLTVPLVAAALGGHDTLIGGAGPNVLQGDSGFNLLLGGTGPNTLFATGGDSLVGGGGANANLFAMLSLPTGTPAPTIAITAGAVQNTLSFATFTAGVTLDLRNSGLSTPQTFDANGDTLLLNGAMQNLVGSAGADQLFAADNTTIYGGGGNDTLTAGNSSNINLVAGAGNVLLQASAATQVTLFGGSGFDTLSASGGQNLDLEGGIGNDSLVASGATNVTLFGGGGNNLLSVSNSTGATLIAGGGGLTESGYTNLTLNGGQGNDTLGTGSTSSSLFGGTGGDTLTSSGGQSISLLGGAGNDILKTTGGLSVTIFGGTGNDSLSASGGTSVSLLGGGGNSTLSSSGGLSVTIFGGTGNDSLATSGGASVSLLGGSGNSTLSSSGGLSVTIFGGTGNDSLSSSGGQSVSLLGGTGNETLSASGGLSVTIFGGTGNDSLANSGGTSVSLLGGGGNSTLSSSGGLSVTIFGGTGNDSISTSGGQTISLLGGSGNDALSTTNGLSVTIFGGTGNDSLSASNGTSVSLLGGGGNSTLSSSGGLSVTIFGGTGNDSISTSGGQTISLLGGSGNDALSSTNGLSVTIFGGTGNDSLTTSGGTNVSLLGGSGNSTLSSSGGLSVTIFGGTGNDSLASGGGTSVSLLGGGGNSTLSSSGGLSVTIFGGTGNDSLSSGGGQSVSLIGGTGSETLSASGGLSVTIFGGTGNDSLSTSSGTAVSLLGGSGNSTLSSGGGLSVTIFGGTGNDSLATSGGQSISLIGGTGNDALSATNGLSVTIFGGTGNDSLSTSGGQSVSLIGGTGRDTLASSGGLSVTIFGGTGNDSITSSGGTSVSLLGGGGNSTLSASGGLSVTVFGGTGNDSLASSGGTAVTMVGGTGNDMLNLTNGVNVTLFGGTGNDTLTSAGGANVVLLGDTGNDLLTSSGDNLATVIGGSGLDTLTATGDSTAILYAGGNRGDSLTSAGGANVTLLGGDGNDTLMANGGQQISLYGLEGDNAYEITGSPTNPLSVTLNDLATFGQTQTQIDSTTQGINTITFPNVVSGIHVDLSDASAGDFSPADFEQHVASGITLSLVGQFQDVVGTPGDDWIHGGGAANLLSGGAGNDTLLGGSAPATILARSGNDSLVAGSGGTLFRFTTTSSGTATISSPAQADNTLDFSQFPGGATVNLASTSPQKLSATLNTTLVLAGTAVIDGVVGSPFGDTVRGNSLDDRFWVGQGNNTFVGGGGNDTYFFSGSQLGASTITETATTNNTLNFLGFAEGVDLDLTETAAQVAARDPLNSASLLTLTLTDPQAFSTVVGSLYADTMVGNDRDNTLIGGGGADSIVSGAGNDFLQGSITQVVYLDFDEPLRPNDHVYTTAERDAVQTRLETIYADFNYTFTQDPALARQLAQATGGQLVTLRFDAGPPGGAAAELDFDNRDLGGSATIDIASFMGQDAGLVPITSANAIALTAEVAAHELGHLAGLRHTDAFGPIGAGVYAGADTTAMDPAYTGPTSATETVEHIMASPDSVGSTLADAAANTFLGEREAIKLAFNDTGTVVNLQDLPTETLAGPTAAAIGWNTAYLVGELPGLAVPNTSTNPLDRDYGQTFDVTAIDIHGSLATADEEDFYAFTGHAGELMNFEVISTTDTLNPRPFLPELEVLDATGSRVAYYNSPKGAYAVRDMESNDPQLFDVVLPADGTYYVGVDALFSLSAGAYDLFLYSFATAPDPASGNTLVGGGGNDTLVASSGNDYLSFLPGSAGNATVVGGSGDDVVDLYPAPRENVTGTGHFTIRRPTNSVTETAVSPSLVQFTYGQSTTFTVEVTADSAVPTGTVQLLIDGTAYGNPQPLVSGAAAFTVQGLHAGTHKVSAAYTSDASTFLNSATPATASAEIDINAAPLTITADNKSMTYGGIMPSLTASYAGLVNGDASAAIHGVTLSTVPATSHVGSYTITVSGASDPDYAITLVNGKLAIGQAPLTVSVDNKSMTYGGIMPSLTASYAGLVNGDASAAIHGVTLSTVPATSHVGSYTITVSGATDPDYSITLLNGKLTIAQAPLTIMADNKTMTYGGTMPSLTATYAGLVNGDTSPVIHGVTLGTVPAKSHAGSYTITVSGATDPDYSITLLNGKLTIAPAPLTITADNKAKAYDAPLPLLTATYVGFVNGDTSSNLTTAPVLATSATVTSPVGNYPITVSGAADTDYAIRFVPGTLTVVENVALVLLDLKSKGTLDATGNSKVQLTGGGAAEVLSNNAAAVVASGNAMVSASQFDIEGSPGASKTGNAALTGLVVKGLTPAQDAYLSNPFASLAAPAMPTTMFPAKSVGGNTVATLKPGTYVGGISVSGNASVTLLPGVYYLKGGGLSVSGNAQLSGQGVLIYNAPQHGGTDAISIAGQAVVQLAAPTSGTYQGIALFQDPASNNAISLSGGASLNITGIVYAAAGSLNASGNAQVHVSGNAASGISARIVADEASLSGNAILTVDASQNAPLFVSTTSSGGPGCGTDIDAILAKYATAIERYIASVYLQVLGRIPDAAGLAYWVAQIASGTAISSVAQTIAHSDEYYASRVIVPDYQKLFGRVADSAGIAYWTQAMRAGLTDQQVEAALAASDEFFNHAGGQTNPVNWIDAIYTLFFGHPADPAGEAYWANDLARTGSRLQVAGAIATSPENETLLINADYFHYLGRAADPGGTDYWLSQLGAGATNEDMIAEFTGSAEYYEQITDESPR